MRKFFSLAVAIVTVTMSGLFSTTSVQAQYYDGYGFAAGAFGNGGFGFFPGRLTPREQPPYFALYPPVYYSGIVPRPYGISPFAAPAGIPPVEICSPCPVTIKNPFIDHPVAPASNTNNPDSHSIDINDKVTWTINPYLDALVLFE